MPVKSGMTVNNKMSSLNALSKFNFTLTRLRDLDRHTDCSEKIIRHCLCPSETIST